METTGDCSVWGSLLEGLFPEGLKSEVPSIPVIRAYPDDAHIEPTRMH